MRQFDNGSTQLAVYRGSLQVIPAQAGSWTPLQAGQQARFGPLGAADQRSASLHRRLGRGHDRRRRATAAGAFLDELGRYRHGHSGCDAALANRRWGTYPLADSDRIIDAVAQTLKLDVQRFTRLWVNLRPSPANV